MKACPLFLFFALTVNAHTAPLARVKEAGQISLPQIPTTSKGPRDVGQIKNTQGLLEHPFYQGLSKKQKADLAIAFVNEVYLAVLGREPYPKEVDGKANVILQGAMREGVYRGVVLSQEYRSLELARRPLSKKSLSFIKSYFATYLKQAFAPKQLKRANFYTVKRLAVEKSLEVIDALENQGDRERWFAVFSHEVGAKFTWRQKYRKLGTKQNFLYWARRAPLDILKSEVIVKIHHLMNSLQ